MKVKVYQVKIMPYRPGVYWNRQWGNLCQPCRTRAEAEEVIKQQKEIDNVFPIGHYRYMIEEVEIDLSLPPIQGSNDGHRQTDPGVGS